MMRFLTIAFVAIIPARSAPYPSFPWESSESETGAASRTASEDGGTAALSPSRRTQRGRGGIRRRRPGIRNRLRRHNRRKRYVFVTAADFPPGFGGVEGADFFCQQSASSAGLRGYYRAWISDEYFSPRQSYNPSGGPFLLLDGTLVAINFQDLTSGYLRHGINMNEYGIYDGVKYVWTGTAADGYRILGYNCNDWTPYPRTWYEQIGYDEPYAVAGITALSEWEFHAPMDYEWTRSMFVTCSDLRSDVPRYYSLYCIQQ